MWTWKAIKGVGLAARRARLAEVSCRCLTPCPFKFSTTLIIILRTSYHVVIMTLNENDWIMFLEWENELYLRGRKWYQMNYASWCEWYQIILPSRWDNRIPRMDCLPGKMIKSQEWSFFGVG